MTSSSSTSFMEETYFSSIISRSLAELTERLATECEQLAETRELQLQQECRLLQEENDNLKQQLARHAPALEEPVPQKLAPDIFIRPSTVNNNNRPHFQPWPEYLQPPVIENELAEDYWASDSGRPGHDHAFFDTGSTHHVEDITKSHFFVIDPTSHTKLTWDMLGIPILGWDLATIPMQVFDIGETPLIVTMSWITMIYWTCDMPCTFVTGYYDKHSNQIMILSKIVKHYLAGFFWLDFIIVASDWIGVVMNLASGGNSEVLENMGALRALRASRFIRLMRLRKLKAKWQTIEDNIESEWSLVCLNLFGKVVGIMALNHYVGCLFYFIGKVKNKEYDTWLSHPFPQFQDTKPEQTLESAPWGYLYITSVHWAITQFTPGSMHIQAQNIIERIFSIFCLLFGLIVFSSFIASVTQARVQLNKMMSKFEKDLWILRKFCRQNKVSRSLTIRMKRYVDMVLVPRYQLMDAEDVVILPFLSQHLRDELRTEMVSHHLTGHPFFKEFTANKAVIRNICISAVGNLTHARGDVIFNAGQVGNHMYMITDGVLEYLPHDAKEEIENCPKGSVISEAVLWTRWTYQGQLQSSVECGCMVVDSVKFRSVLIGNAFAMAFSRRYAYSFLQKLNKDIDCHGAVPNDLQQDICSKISIKDLKQSRHSEKWFAVVSTAATENGQRGSDSETI